MFITIHINYSKIHSSPLYEASNHEYFIVKNDAESIFITLRKRPHYPVTYCKRQNDGSFTLGYGKGRGLDSEEYLYVTIDQHGTLSITRDAFITLPLFFAREENRLVISNIYTDVHSSLPTCTISTSRLLTTLAPHIPAMQTTLIKEVRMLSEREILFSNQRVMNVRYPSPRSWTTSQNAPSTNPRHYSEILGKHLEYFIESRLEGEDFACDVSGGLDSATLPCFLRKKYNVRVPLATLWYSGSQGKSQRHKVSAVMKYAGSAHYATTLNETTDFPYNNMILSNDFYAPFTDETAYFTAFSRLADILQTHRITVICTGVGGDDILENVPDLQYVFGYGKAEVERRRTQHLPSFLSAHFRADYIRETPGVLHRPLPLLPLSTLTPASTNNIYIERDIWPVSPFMQPSLYEFCQGLPALFRANKNILRALHHTYQFPEVIYGALRNEDFSTFFDNAMRSPHTTSIILRLTAHSVTANLGYVDTHLLLDTLQKAIDNRQVQDDLYGIYRWLGVELHEQSRYMNCFA